MSSPARLLAAAALACVPLAWASPARADVSSWMSAAAGPIRWKQGDADYTVAPALQFGSGTDLGVLLRGTTRGFQEGGFGLALDAGGYARFWDENSYGFLGSLTVGAPFGLTLTLQGALGTHSAVALGGVLGIDFLRLTVYRKTMTDIWPNPYSSPRTARADSPQLSF